MERCRLCYGRIVNGRCVDCGLDNSKSDKNYRLNTHNPKSVRMHGGDCDAHVNKETPRTVPNGSARARQLKKRQATGTVQRKKGKKWVVVLLVAAVYVIPSVIEIAGDHMDEIRETVNSFGDGSLGGLISEIFREEQEADSFENPEIATHQNFYQMKTGNSRKRSCGIPKIRCIMKKSCRPVFIRLAMISRLVRIRRPVRPGM